MIPVVVTAAVCAAVGVVAGYHLAARAWCRVSGEGR